MWKVYAEQEMKMKHYQQVQAILNHCLLKIKCVDVELWKFYVNFTLITKYQAYLDSGDEELKKLGRKTVNQAYELAIEHIGVCVDASAIWVGYINFLKSDSDPQAFVSVRKVYQRAITIPLANMDAIWRNYENFEKDIPNNDALYQNFMKLLQPKFEAARAILRRRKPFWDKVATTSYAAPETSKSVTPQLKAWEHFIEYELTNPELLEPFGLRSRLRFVFEACLSSQRYRPELWYRYAEFEKSLGDHPAATAVYQRAIEAIPDSELLYFSFADHKELSNDISGAKDLYETLLRSYPSALVYINYQRFVRRASGADGLEQARLIFKRARKDQRPGVCTHHIFSAAALLEYYTVPAPVPGQQSGRDPKAIALNIFELGLRKYIHEVDYVTCYLDFLMHLKEDNSRFWIRYTRCVNSRR